MAKQVFGKLCNVFLQNPENHHFPEPMIKYLEGKGSLMAFSLHNTGQAITIPTVKTCNTPSNTLL